MRENSDLGLPALEGGRGTLAGVTDVPELPAVEAGNGTLAGYVAPVSIPVG